MTSSDFSSHLEAVREGNLEQIMSYCENFPEILTERDESQATLLHHIAAINKTRAMQHLIETGINLNTVDNDGNTALHVATIKQHPEAISLLLQSGIRDEILNHDQYAGLHIAARLNNTDVMTAYLEHSRVNLTVEGYRKRTPLHIMAEHDSLEVFEIFCNAILTKFTFGDAFDLLFCPSDESGLIPVHLAAREGAHRVLHSIIVNAQLHGISSGDILGLLDEENYTPLHSAIDRGHLDLVCILLKHGANPAIEKGSQLPPFLLACCLGRQKMIELILANGEPYNIIYCRDSHGQTCLHHCVQNINSILSLTSLLDRGADINAIDNKGQTAIMTSIIIGNIEGVSTLMARGADVTIADNHGNNVVHHAVNHKREIILELLLQVPQASGLATSSNNSNQSPVHLAFSKNFNTMAHALLELTKSQATAYQDSDGNGYLHLAALGGDCSAICYLLNISGCVTVINCTNKQGYTPLHFAASGGHLKCTEILLTSGAMVHKSHCGSTPFMEACYYGHKEVAQLIFETHPFQLKWTNRNGENALHMAAKSGSTCTIKYCLDIGVPTIHNYHQESFFDEIVSKNHRNAAAAVIRHSRYQEALDLKSPHQEHPMINLIISMPNVAELVLDRCITKSDHPQHSSDYLEKYDFKYLNFTTTTNNIQDSGEERLIISNEEEAAASEFIKYKSNNGSSETGHGSAVSVKASPLIVLKTMLKYGRTNLLTHPATDYCIKYKWMSYGRWISYFISLTFFLQVAFQLCFSSLVENPSKLVAATTSSNSKLCGESFSNSTSLCPEFSQITTMCRFLAIAFAGLNLAILLCFATKNYKEVFKAPINVYFLIDMVSILSTMAYLLPFEGLNSAFWTAGAVSSLFGWFSLLIKVQVYSLAGIYITMFLATTKRALQVLFTFSPFLLGFAFSFYILAGNTDTYSTIGYSIFISLGHALGDLRYDSLVNEDVAGNLQHGTLTFLLASIMGILLGVVVMNLLIGLAVGDIENIKSNAIITQKKVQITFFSFVEATIPDKVLLKLDQSVYTLFPNRKTGICLKLMQLLSYLWHDSIKIVAPESDTRHKEILEGKEIALIKSKLEDLAFQQEKMMEIVKETQEAMFKIFAQKREDTM